MKKRKEQLQKEQIVKLTTENMTEAADLMMHELEVKIKAMTADEILQANKK